MKVNAFSIKNQGYEITIKIDLKLLPTANGKFVIRRGDGWNHVKLSQVYSLLDP